MITRGLRGQLQQPSGNWTQNYLYDASRRLLTITAPGLSANPFTYAYSGTGRRVGRATFPTGAYVGKDYDTLGKERGQFLVLASGQSRQLIMEDSMIGKRSVLGFVK